MFRCGLPRGQGWAVHTPPVPRLLPLVSFLSLRITTWRAQGAAELAPSAGPRFPLTAQSGPSGAAVLIRTTCGPVKARMSAPNGANFLILSQRRLRLLFSELPGVSDA